MTDETGKGWWDGHLLDEFRGVLETVPEDDPRITPVGPLRADPTLP